MNLLLVYDRAHGESEGKHITFGYKERHDVAAWADKLVALFGKDSEIILQGVSMGAATVLMAAGSAELPLNVRAVVADCAYSSMKEEIRHNIHSMRLPATPLYHFSSLWCRLCCGFFYGQADTAAFTHSIGIPVLFIHGEDDSFVPTRMVHTLYEACHAPKSLLLVPGAGHAESYLTDTDAYQKAVKELIETV